MVRKCSEAQFKKLISNAKCQDLLMILESLAQAHTNLILRSKNLLKLSIIGIEVAVTAMISAKARLKAM
jgi:hypothetical protein